jgi:hypothetical protein
MVYLQDDLLLYRNFEKTHRHGRQVILVMYEVCTVGWAGESLLG